VVDRRKKDNMSKKHKAAIEAQQYTSKFQAGVCGNCAHRVVKMQLPLWMRGQPHYTPETHGAEQSTCGIGGFQVRKLGSCCEHAFAGEPASA
jgi:hypothetical protein